jgi:hypothetical protein
MYMNKTTRREQKIQWIFVRPDVMYSIRHVFTNFVFVCSFVCVCLGVEFFCFCLKKAIDTKKRNINLLKNVEY